MDNTQPSRPGSDVGAAIDQLLDPVYPADEPGAAIIVTKRNEVIYRRAYGLANVELSVPMQPDQIFRIGSITKQFTSVAILMLVESGKLDLDDDITRFLPDYPTHGHRITVEHLLTHTSGIKSYTNRPDFREHWRKDLGPTELIASFKNLPMEFAPGERYNYNNSGYVLLGAIIEAISGHTYAEFLDRRVFQPLSLTKTSFDRSEQIVRGRAAGYDRESTGWHNAAFISMTQPYSAGSLMSTVDDLVRWTAGLAAGQLVSSSLLQRAWTPFQLNDGGSTGYGYGWGVGRYAGHRILHHGGGIPGFITHALWLPDDRVFVAVLTNSTGKDPGPGQLATKIGGLAIGEPYEDPRPISLDPGALEAFVGVYLVRAHDKRTILRDDAKLILESGDGSRHEIVPMGEDQFFVKDDSFTRVHFFRSGRGGPLSLAITGIDLSEQATRTGD